jgi:predicted negative regulator of RcsB-dependent stress response
MSEEKSVVTDSSKSGHTPIPENLPEELLPLYDWWKANGSQFLITVAAAAVLLGGGFAFKQYRAAKTFGANQELLKAVSLDELEAVVAKYGTTKAGNATRLRLAKAYYDASKYDEALGTYEACIAKGAPVGFKEIAELGRAHALEALGRLDEALTAYQAFEKTQADHFLQPQAAMGIARVLTLQGKKDEAKKFLENLKAQKTGESAWEMAVANLEGVVNRYEPRAERSLFEAAEAAAQTAQPVAAEPAATTAPAAPEK